MSRVRGHRTLDWATPLYVKRDMTIASKTFKLGELLPWQELKLDPRKVYQLWFQRRIGHEKPGERNGAESRSALVAPYVPPPAPPLQPAKSKPQQPRR